MQHLTKSTAYQKDTGFYWPKLWSFIYLGSEIHSTGSSVRRRTGLAKSCFNLLNRGFWRSSISPPTKVQLYHTYIQPVVLCDSETWALTRALQDKVDAFDNMCLHHILHIPYTDHVTNATVRLQPVLRPSCLSSSRPDGFDFLDKWQGWIRHLISREHSKTPSEGCPRTGDAHPVVLITPGYAPWKQISNLLTLASTQHGNTLRIENIGSTSWKPLRSSLGIAHDDDDKTPVTIIFRNV